MENKYVDVEVDKLKPHPENERIYGKDEDASDLKDQIEEFGSIIEKLKITDEYVVISGHRRLKAAKELGYETVPCEFVKFDSPEEELAALIQYNYRRVKTNLQRAREGLALSMSLSVLKDKRRLANLKQNRTDVEELSTSEDAAYNLENHNNESENGRTRDIIASAVGFRNGKDFDYSKGVLNRIDELKSEGNERDSELFVAVLNRSTSAANDLLNVELGNLSTEDRDKLRTGKIAPSRLIPKNNKKNVIPYKKIAKEFNRANGIIEHLLESLKSIKHIQEDELKEWLKEIYAETDSLRNFHSKIQSVLWELEEDDRIPVDHS